MTSQPLLTARDVSLRFGNVHALDRVSFDVRRGEIFAVIGPNGAGKSSLFNVLSRVYDPTSGDVTLDGRDMLRWPPRAMARRGVARSFQNLGLFPHLSVVENVLIGRHHLMRTGALRGGFLVGTARREERIHRRAAHDALQAVGIDTHAETKVHQLPYGVQKKVELARCLAMEPTVLLLDEPVAGMSGAERVEISDLIQQIHRDRETTVVIVEHDMGMIMRIAHRVLVLDFGRVIAQGTANEIQNDDRVIRAYLGAELEVAP